MKYRLSAVILLALMALFLSCASVPSTGSAVKSDATSFSSKKESIAFFPLIGGRIEDGESIISSLGRQNVMYDAFEKITVLTRSNIAAMNFEREFQQYSGLTDADTIFALGRDLNAAYVIAGYITNLGNQNLIILSIMEVESLRQIAGVYRTYDTLREINTMIPDIANSLVSAVSRVAAGLPGLSVPPFDISTDVIGQNDAMVLAQILSCDLSNSGRFAVLPRTENIQTVLAEHRRQRSGIVNRERLSRLGEGYNADYVLSGKVERLDDINKFAVDILNVEDGSTLFGREVEYNNFSKESITLMQELAARLSGQMSEEDAKRAAEERQGILAADAEAAARRDAAARAKAAADAEAAAKAAAAARAKEERKWERERYWDEKKDIDTNAIGALGYFQWGDNGLMGGGFELFSFRITPIPFTTIGCDTRAGIQADENFDWVDNPGSGNITAGLTMGLVWPFTDWFRLYADGVLDIGWFGYYKGLIAPIISPGVIVSVTFGTEHCFIIQYKHTWHENRNTQFISAGWTAVL